MKAVNPYLTFNGNCEEAFEFYKAVFEGEFTFMSRFEDAPADSGMEVSEGDKKKILHVDLAVDGKTILMGNDLPEGMDAATVGSNVSVSIQTSSEAETDKLFHGLAEGGKVTMPPAKAFWNAYFGMCTDKFGVHWILNFGYES